MVSSSKKRKDDLTKSKISNRSRNNLKDARKRISRQKYGLVFEEHHEISKGYEKVKIVEEVALRIDRGGEENLLIEGENLVALKFLERKYSSRIDVMCIDPPYNTGMDWLNYADHQFKDKKDQYSHSKWLSFMKARLKIAYRLMSDHGVMFINIDENETGTLLLLCHQIFGENNVDVLIWPKTDKRFDMNRVEKPPRDIKIVHEYVFVCFKDRGRTKVNKIMLPYEIDGKLVDRPSTMETIIKGLGTTSSAKDELGEIFGDRLIFQTPKPMRLIREFIRFASNDYSIIMDFFAGSGTTGHATMDLNKEDGGHRSFILVTNNENNICKDITYQRLKRVIHREGFKESLKYLRIE